MASDTVRIRPETHRKLKELAAAYGQPMPDILDRAVEMLRRQAFLEANNEAFARLRADPKAWAEELEERAVWDTTLMDGLEDDE